MVKIEQESVGAFNKGVGRVLVILEEGELVDDVGFEDLAEFLVLSVHVVYRNEGEGREKYLEHSNLILNIILQLPKPCPIPSFQQAQLPLKNGLIQNLTNPHTPPRRLITVTRTNALSCCPDLPSPQSRLLQAIHNRMQLEADVGAVGDENALVSGGQALFLEGGQFFEEAGDVHDGASTDEIDAFGGDEARGEDVKVVGYVVVDDGVAGVCSIS